MEVYCNLYIWYSHQLYSYKLWKQGTDPLCRDSSGLHGRLILQTGILGHPKQKFLEEYSGLPQSCLRPAAGQSKIIRNPLISKQLRPLAGRNPVYNKLIGVGAGGLAVNPIVLVVEIQQKESGKCLL